MLGGLRHGAVMAAGGELELDIPRPSPTRAQPSRQELPGGRGRLERRRTA